MGLMLDGMLDGMWLLDGMKLLDGMWLLDGTKLLDGVSSLESYEPTETPESVGELVWFLVKGRRIGWDRSVACGLNAENASRSSEDCRSRSDDFRFENGDSQSSCFNGSGNFVGLISFD